MNTNVRETVGVAESVSAAGDLATVPAATVPMTTDMEVRTLRAQVQTLQSVVERLQSAVDRSNVASAVEQLHARLVAVESRTAAAEHSLHSVLVQLDEHGRVVRLLERAVTQPHGDAARRRLDYEGNYVSATTAARRADLSAYVLRFGKHESKTLGWVLQNDPSYITWVYQQETPSPTMSAFREAVAEYRALELPSPPSPMSPSLANALPWSRLRGDSTSSPSTSLPRSTPMARRPAAQHTAAVAETAPPLPRIDADGHIHYAHFPVASSSSSSTRAPHVGIQPHAAYRFTTIDVPTSAPSTRVTHTPPFTPPPAPSETYGRDVTDPGRDVARDLQARAQRYDGAGAFVPVRNPARRATTRAAGRTVIDLTIDDSPPPTPPPHFLCPIMYDVMTDPYTLQPPALPTTFEYAAIRRHLDTKPFTDPMTNKRHRERLRLQPDRELKRAIAAWKRDNN